MPNDHDQPVITKQRVAELYRVDPEFLKQLFIATQRIDLTEPANYDRSDRFLDAINDAGLTLVLPTVAAEVDLDQFVAKCRAAAVEYLNGVRTAAVGSDGH